jgi:type I restriction enzyme M protein
MQPLQRRYEITDESIERLMQSGVLSKLYDEAKVLELEEKGENMTAKEKAKLEAFKKSKPQYDSILDALNAAKSEEKYMSPEAFLPVINKVLPNVDSKLVDKIANVLSVMDKNAEIQREKKGKNKGKIIYDKDTKDTEIVKYDEDIEDYMAREVLPHIPDAKWFFEENLAAKKPVIKTGAEIPFTRCFYKYQKQAKSEDVAARMAALIKEAEEIEKKLFG